MAKFSFEDADDDAAGGGDKRKRHDSVDADDDAAGGGDKRKRHDSVDADTAGRPKARNPTIGAGDEVEERVAGAKAGGCSRRRLDKFSDGGGDDGISVRIDPDVLDCSICFEPLCPPLYQCQNGHVACSSCWSKLKNKCHICSCEAYFARNIALEKVVESIKSSCSYAKWGCCKVVSYAQRNTHEETCCYAPSLCPIPGCGYRGFTGWWSGHFLVNHSADAVRFLYDESFKLNLEVSMPFVVLLGEDDHLFLLLNKNMMPFGHGFSVVCLRPRNLKWKFSYKIKAASRGNCANNLQLMASVTNTKDWAGIHPADAFLLVPYGFCSGNVILDVCIQRYADD